MGQNAEPAPRRKGYLPLAAVLLVAVALLAASCGGGADDAGDASGGTPASSDRAQTTEGVEEDVEVRIADFTFAPEAVRVRSGGTVTWVNEDGAAHTAQTAGDDTPRFDTGTLRMDQSKAIDFDAPGTYEYLCGFHMFMVGTVEVVE